MTVVSWEFLYVQVKEKITDREPNTLVQTTNGLLLNCSTTQVCLEMHRRWEILPASRALFIHFMWREKWPNIGMGAHGPTGSIKWLVHSPEGARWKTKDVEGLMGVDTVDTSVKISFIHMLR